MMSKKMKNILATIMLAGIISIGSLGMTKGVDAFALGMIITDENGNAQDQVSPDGMYGIHANWGYRFLNPQKTEVELNDYYKFGADKLDFLEYPTEFMGAKVTSIDFSTQRNVKGIEIPSTVETVSGIGYCRNIETLIVPKNVKNFDSGLRDCVKLKTITFYKETNVPFGSFDDAPKDLIVYAEKGSTAELSAIAAGIKCVNIDTNGNIIGDANMEDLIITKDQDEFHKYSILNKNLKTITIFKETAVQEFNFNKLDKNIIIRCEKGSSAEKEAKRAGLKIVTIDSNGNEIRETTTTPEEPSTPETPQEPQKPETPNDSTITPGTITPDTTVTPGTTTTSTPEQPPKKTGDVTSLVGIAGLIGSFIGLKVTKKEKNK